MLVEHFNQDIEICRCTTNYLFTVKENFMKEIELRGDNIYPKKTESVEEYTVHKVK